METRSVRLDEDVYETIKARKRDDETFSEAIERLIDGALAPLASRNPRRRGRHSVSRSGRRGRYGRAQRRRRLTGRNAYIMSSWGFSAPRCRNPVEISQPTVLTHCRSRLSP
ncbi:antitoxin VapB family protein [Halapricum hydrolyticum]|uniref:antitoxin VapB family protein n=1 Tax=Halapricum hydrolyticum TaxID=2979991 RepID=UPI0028F726C3|nr:antitoxin VapB family protein [Halapricum hydrolyticum]